MYLLLYSKLNEKEMEWLMKNAIPVSPLCWIHTSEIPGTVPVKIGTQSYRSLSEQISHHASVYLSYVEGKIRSNGFRGISKRLAMNKLRLIAEVCNEMELIGLAKDMLYILGEDEEYNHESKPEAIEKQTSLGLAKDDIENYLLSLSKKPTLH